MLFVLEHLERDSLAPPLLSRRVPVARLVRRTSECQTESAYTVLSPFKRAGTSLSCLLPLLPRFGFFFPPLRP